MRIRIQDPCIISSSKLILRINFYNIRFLCCLFVLVLLFDGRLALGQDSGYLPGHEGPGHVGAWEGAALPTWAEYFIVGSLLLDRVGGAREAKFVMTHSRALVIKIFIQHISNIIIWLPVQNVYLQVFVCKGCISTRDYLEGSQ